MDALYGIQTLRASTNFSITGLSPHIEFIRAYALLKKCTALANKANGNLPNNLATPIIQACQEIVEGKHLDAFIIDRLANITSFNMNVNEVIANRALEIMGKPKGQYTHLHPNDHVNMGQSTNDTFPTAMSIAILQLWPVLRKTLEATRDAFWNKGTEFKDIIKSGRTHLQDAVPTSLGFEFRAYGTVFQSILTDFSEALKALETVPIGGSAVGTGMNTHSDYISQFLQFIKIEGIPLRDHQDLPFIQHCRMSIGKFSGVLRTLSQEMIRIANDLRLLSSGPTSGLADISLPAVQPGSSIMPGKVNPVMAESLNMIGFRILGHDLTVSLAVQAGQLELNVMMPVMIDAILDSMKMLIRYLPIFISKCVQGIVPRLNEIKSNLEKNPSLATVLNPLIGYDKASDIAKTSIKTNQSIREVLLQQKLFTEEEIDKLFSRSTLFPHIKLKKLSNE